MHFCECTQLVPLLVPHSSVDYEYKQKHAMNKYSKQEPVQEMYKKNYEHSTWTRRHSFRLMCCIYLRYILFKLIKAAFQLNFMKFRIGLR